MKTAWIWNGCIILVGLAVLSGCKNQQDSTTSKTEKSRPAAVQSEVRPAREKAAVRQPFQPSLAVSPQPVVTDRGQMRIEWLTDFEAAKKLAHETGKDMILDFTGSDWCYWCKLLEKEVLSQKLFAVEATKYFVFVKLDFPQNKTGLSEKLQQQNQMLYDRYGIKGFPTLILADAKGKQYAQSGYEKGGPMGYLQRLSEFRAQKQAP